jgi:hypothetical protein
MAPPALQLRFDPNRSPQDVEPKTLPFERTTDYEFASGEKIKVRQKSNGLRDTDEKMIVEVKLDGKLPNVETVSWEFSVENLLGSKNAPHRLTN